MAFCRYRGQKLPAKTQYRGLAQERIGELQILCLDQTLMRFYAPFHPKESETFPRLKYPNT